VLGDHDLTLGAPEARPLAGIGLNDRKELAFGDSLAGLYGDLRHAAEDECVDPRQAFVACACATDDDLRDRGERPRVGRRVPVRENQKKAVDLAF
jgi:hypothetical protein